MGLVSFGEPFTRLINQGQVLNGGKAMSKSLGNGVDLSEQIGLYGVDAIRLTMVFASPPQDDIDWADVSPGGSLRFLQRAWRLSGDVTSEPGADPGAGDEALRKVTHRTIHDATQLVESYRFNVMVAKVMELTGGRGADVAFEVIGLGPTIEQTLQMTRRGGQSVIVGVPSFDTQLTLTPAMDLLVNEKQIRGCWYGSSNVHRDVPKLAALYQDGSLMLDELMSAQITLDQVNQAMENMGSGEIARSVIVY